MLYNTFLSLCYAQECAPPTSLSLFLSPTLSGTLVYSLDLQVRLCKGMLCCVKSHQPCPTLCDPLDCGPPGSSVHGIL